MGHNYIGTEHLLLGLLKEKEGIAAKVLNALGIRLVETREKILNLLQEPATKTKEKSKTPALDEFGRDLTELAQVLPTAAIQAFADDAMENRTAGQPAERPYELDRCHALRADGPAVEKYYPQWVLKAVPG